MSESRRYPVAAMLAFTRDALVACGVPDTEAATAAKAMIEADITGFDAHGIFRLGMYVAGLKSGRVNAKANIKPLQRSPSTALVDGDNGIGHLVMTYAANLAVELARASGVGWVGVRRSNHSGAGSTYVSIPVAHGMAGIYTAVSSSNFMAPWGGAEPLLGTNPIAMAIPAGEEPPVVLDIATSVVAFGTIRNHKLQNKPMPEGWMVDPETGESVTDPNQGGHALLLPMAGYKGAGLSLMFGLLAGTLNGAFFGRDVVDFNDHQDAVTNTGQFILALDPARFQPIASFKAEMDRQSRSLRASKMTPGQSARLPGDMRAQRRADRLANGVALTDVLLKQLDTLAAELAITPIRDRG
jgi:LDH2 family malate/lactate/ureidoglycolate dehydrogenase